VLVTLTDRGREVMAAMDAEHEQLGAQLIDGLDEATAAATLKGLTHIHRRLSALVEEHAARTEDAR
jgi:DNA-binding MarR family transcriptional regulator